MVREVIKACLAAIGTKDKGEKKFVLAVLYDMSISPILVKIIKEIPWNEGIGKLVNFGFLDEPVCVSIIISNLHRDIVVRN